MVWMLQHGQVEVREATAPVTVEGKTYPAGSYVVLTKQPFGAYAKALLERETLTRDDIEVLRRGEQLPPRTPTTPPTAPAPLTSPVAEPRRMPPIIGGPEPSPA